MNTERLDDIRSRALDAIKQAGALEALNEVRVSFTGKKGELTEVLKGMKDVAKEDRPKVGALVNETRDIIEAAINEAKANLEARALEARLEHEAIDVTLPAKRRSLGHLHPNAIALDELERIFIGMGYAEGQSGVSSS